MTVRRTFHLGANDLSASLDFYRRVVGLKVTQQSEVEAWLDGWGTTVVLHRGNGLGLLQPPTRGRASMELVVSIDQLEVVWNEVRSKDPSATGPQVEGHMMNYVVLDPGGNGLSLVTPLPMATDGEAKASPDRTTRRLKPIDG